MTGATTRTATVLARYTTRDTVEPAADRSPAIEEGELAMDHQEDVLQRVFDEASIDPLVVEASPYEIPVLTVDACELCRAYATLNTSIEFFSDDLSIKLYATNLFDKKAWMTGRRYTDLSNIPLNFATAGQGAFLTPNDRREVGIQVRKSF